MTKIAVIGAGRWGQNHIRTLYELGNLGAIIESSVDRVSELKKQYPNIVFFNNLEEDGALKYDGYTVAVPAEAHFEVAKICLNAGKHVLVEKPITTNVKDAEILVKLADDKKAILMVGHLLLFHPAIQKIKGMITTNKLGKLQYMYSNRLNLGTVRTEENSLWSFAPHDFSIFEYFTDDQPNEISCTGGAFLQPHIHDTTVTSLKYPHNVKGHIFVSWLHPFKEHRLVLIGSKGMVSYEDSTESKELLFYEKGIDWINGQPKKREGATEIISYEKVSPLTAELSHFVNCIEGKEENTIINGKNGLSVLNALETAHQKLIGDQ